MTKLSNKGFRAMVPLLREEDFYEAEKEKPILWPQYTLAQIEEARTRLAFIRDSVDDCAYLEVKGKTGRPLTNPKSLAKAVLVCESFGFTEREAQGWLEILSPYLGIKEKLDDKTIGDAYDKPEVLFILKQIFEETKSSNEELCGDGTGLETSRKQNYETNKKTPAFMTTIVDTREIVQAFDIHQHERNAMHELIFQVKGKSQRLDAGFVDRLLVKKIVQNNMVPYIFPKKNLTLNGNLNWKNMYLELYNDVMQWLTKYHQRSHCESFHSSFKRRFGIVTKRRSLSQLTQITALIILHNRRRSFYFNLIQQKN